MFHVILILALLLSASRATDESIDWFRNWFDDQLKEIIDEPLVLNIVGTIPKYVQGRLVRVGPTQLITKGHNLTNYLDGFGRISTWDIDGSSSAGQVKFMSAFIRSNLYNASIPADDVSPHITQEPTQKRTPPGKFDLDTMDNTDVNVHRFGNEKTVMVMTDFYIANDIDMGSLRTLHVSNITGSVPYGSTFSGSHPATWVNPVTREELLVNWVGAKGPKYFELSVYIMGQDRVRHVRGHVMLEHQPYSIHSIAVADNFCIVTIGPVSLDFIKSGVTLCVSCSTENNMDNGQTIVYAFDLLGGHADSRPVTIPVPGKAFWFFHHVNAAVTDDSTLVVDYCSYESMNGLLGDHILGNMRDLSSKSVRNHLAYQCDGLTRLRIDVSTSQVVEKTNLAIVDADSQQYHVELVSTNPRFQGDSSYCYAYGVSQHFAGSRQFEDMGIIKMDLCSGAPGRAHVVAHSYKVGRYVGEPVFVPDPAGQEEDDGVLLVVARERDESSLLVIDAQTMITVACVKAPFPLFFEFHGKFFSESGDESN